MYVWGIPRQIDQAEILDFSFIQVYRWPENITSTNFQIFLKNSVAVMIEVVYLALRAVIDSFEI